MTDAADRKGYSGAMSVGLVTLGDLLADPSTGRCVSETQRFREIVELGAHAEQIGLERFHVGEHHFNDYVLSSPTPVLAAVAERTASLRLSTAVSLLPHHDPVRIAEDYATVDVLSGGRVELVAGRGIAPELYAQYGQHIADGEQLLGESVALLRRLWTEHEVSWTGRIRPALEGVTVRPRPVQRPHPPIWLSASSPASITRAVLLRCPIVIPTVSVGPDAPPVLAAQFRDEWLAAGNDAADCRIALHVHCYVGDGTHQDAVEEWRPYQLGYLRWVVDTFRSPGAPLPPVFTELGTSTAQAVCGNVDTVVAELDRRLTAMGGADVLLVQMDQGGLPAHEVHATVARLAQAVVPRLITRPLHR